MSPQSEERSLLLRILQQAETYADKIQRRPIAEVIMHDRGLSQIHDLEVIDSLAPLPVELPPVEK